jgi:hypothetical protein
MLGAKANSLLRPGPGGRGQRVGEPWNTALLALSSAHGSGSFRVLPPLFPSPFNQDIPMRTLPTIACFLVLNAAAAAAHAQAQPQGPGWQSFISMSPVFEEGDLDSGGDMSVSGLILRLGTSTGFGSGHRAGITLNYDYADYSFTDPKAFGNVAPWGVLQRYGVTTPFNFAVDGGWSIGVAPSVDWFREEGASDSDAMVWGATLTAVRRYENGNFLGLGLAAFSGIEDNTFFPFPIFRWQLAPQWRLINPLPAGPTGGAGVELDYELNDAWTLGAGFTWRTARYRLSRTGPSPNGVGEISGAPVYLRARLAIGQTGALNVYGGVVAAGELSVEDANGNVLRQDDLKTTPMIGANLTVRF